MRVVTALQRRGEVVAVTGDGANDAPALKHADIGVAMGASGTDVAREASAMVLLDDSFASIAAAVKLGRSVYQNIRKFLIFLFSHNIAELVPILAATFVGFPLVPITAVQILAIDLGSDVLPALALGAEPPEPDVMDRPPRSRRERLFSATVVRRFLFLGARSVRGGVRRVLLAHPHLRHPVLRVHLGQPRLPGGDHHDPGRDRGQPVLQRPSRTHRPARAFCGSDCCPIPGCWPPAASASP